MSNDDEKPLASWPCPETVKHKYKQTSKMQIELSKLISELNAKKAKFEADCLEMWNETKQSLANMYPDHVKKIYGATGLHYNEETDKIECWHRGKGPFKDHDRDMPHLPLVLNMGPGNKDSSGGKIVDKTQEVLGEALGRKRDLDLGLDDKKDDDDEDDGIHPTSNN